MGNTATYFFVNATSDSSEAANTCKEEGIALILDNSFLASKEEMSMNAHMYEQHEEENEKCVTVY